jgi:hypothetical protein
MLRDAARLCLDEGVVVVPMAVANPGMSVLMHVGPTFVSGHPCLVLVLMRSIVQFESARRQVETFLFFEAVMSEFLFGFVIGMHASRTMFVSMAVTGQAPNQKADARDHQNPADDVALLGFDLLLELEADQGHHTAQRDRGEDMACCRQG